MIYIHNYSESDENPKSAKGKQLYVQSLHAKKYTGLDIHRRPIIGKLFYRKFNWRKMHKLISCSMILLGKQAFLSNLIKYICNSFFFGNLMKLKKNKVIVS